MKKLVFLLILIIGYSTVTGQTRYKIATWNIEWLKDGKKRGFPETPDKYEDRSDDNYKFMADMIKDQEFKIIALQEINGKTKSTFTGSRKHTSKELDRLISKLGGDWKYVIGTTGRSQRLAFIYDGKFVEGKSFCQTRFRNQRVQDESLFARQPLIGFFRFKKDGETMNDLVLVNVHLASGQHNNKNHDAAMKQIVSRITQLQGNDDCFPQGEQDIVILGDFNANRFDDKEEVFWKEMEDDGWDVLADRKSEYNATRLSGNPLKQGRSRIDYIIISDGLDGKEVTQNLALIHEDLLDGDPDKFREQASDHIPVSIFVKIIDDND